MIKVLDYTSNPLTVMGTYAGVCTGADISNKDKNKGRGIECIRAGHRKVGEFATIDLLITGYSAKVMREVYTHCVGISKLQDSTRRKDMKDFEYFIPFDIRDNKNYANKYFELMDKIKSTYEYLIKEGIQKEDASYILPMSYKPKTIMKFNVTSLAHMFEERSCSRALYEFRTLLTEIHAAIMDLDDEWGVIAEECFQCKCDKLGYCPEVKSCGYRPTKEKISFDLKPEYLERK